ncbi:MAG TPA: hypothetical protein VEJ39_10670 [Candidatus Acidoferrales bacterium]|nr:hypothetical protein [Candidatus Acidoferrales bacterium]
MAGIAGLRDVRRFGVAAFMVVAALIARPLVAAAQQNDNPPQQNSTPSAQTGHSDTTPPPASPEKAAPAPASKQTDPKKAESKDSKTDEAPESKLRISVTAAETGKPVGNASVYIRFPEGKTFFTHKDKQAEMNFKTNQDGSVKVPGVPRGKILIQVIAPGWHTYGKWYDVAKDEEEIEIKLDKPPRWY